jgi:hypothetical protein
MLPGLGHVPMADDPDLVADILLDFTARHSQREAERQEEIQPAS